jgi:hypothetical protein
MGRTENHAAGGDSTGFLDRRSIWGTLCSTAFGCRSANDTVHGGDGHRDSKTNFRCHPAHTSTDVDVRAPRGVDVLVAHPGGK